MNTIPFKKALYGAIYGGVAGFVFSFFAWGYHSIIMATHHLAAPWFSYIVGGILVLFLTIAAGYFSVLSNSTFTSSIMWTLTGILGGAIAILVPLAAYPKYIVTIEPSLSSWVQFQWNDAYMLFLGFALLYSALTFLIIGLLENSLVESAYFTLSYGQLIMAILVSALLGGLIGGIIDSFANSNIRKSVVALDNIITYVLQHKDEDISKETKRNLHLAALNSVKEELSEDHKLIIFSVNETFDQSQILLQTGDLSALCYVFQDQPSNCTIANPGEN